MAISVDAVRQEWERGERRLEALAHDRGTYAALLDQVEVLTDELRRRVGQTFTLAELADAYQGAEDWVRDIVVAASSAPDSERAGGVGRAAGVRDAALVQDAAFAQYARGATDYRP